LPMDVAALAHDRTDAGHFVENDVRADVVFHEKLLV
jgi:hypothetical protein